MSERDMTAQPNLANTKAETDKKCPACGGTMSFDPQTGGLACPYCGFTAPIEAVSGDEPTSAQELDFASAEQVANCDWGAETKTVLCKSCGAESIYDALAIGGGCPYCGSNQVMEEKGKDTLAPGGVCAFKIDAKGAGGRFQSWIRRKWFCPRIAKEKAKPKEFHGVYLPYWTFDANTTSRYTGKYGVDRKVRDKDGKEKTVTDWHMVSGTYREVIDDQLVLGSNRHDESMLRNIEPFETANNLTYKPEYLAGFAAERYSVGLKDAWEKAKQFIKNRITSAVKGEIRQNHHADHSEVSTLHTVYRDVTYKYLLLPVWMSSFTYKDKVYQFMVNGQTGKVSGKTPISALRVAIAVAIGLALIALVWYIYSTQAQ